MHNYTGNKMSDPYIGGLVQERCNSIANARSCTKPSIMYISLAFKDWIMESCQAVSPAHSSWHWLSQEMWHYNWYICPYIMRLVQEVWGRRFHGPLAWLVNLPANGPCKELTHWNWSLEPIMHYNLSSLHCSLVRPWTLFWLYNINWFGGYVALSH